ncbi:hypothetical protein I7I53_09705 [Histoplasma capsulatum var. duboisii H88]|uniref:GPI mannosyltransferase 2 n=1 Tax=Ajellomyces capsulatus (strain H88) TaxID=544711 RepID=A0A8A1LC80_AJEC8|nr:hypothetical protein I7I53_09705 [Histoplasma capsulatum var. duboisii H88]
MRLTASSPSPRWQWICGTLLDHPLSSLSVLFVFWKLLLLLAVVASPGPGYDTSTTLLPSTASASATDSSLLGVGTVIGGGSGWSSSLLKLVRWDAIYFVSIAQRGYIFEQEWAFGYGYTKLLSFLSSVFWGVPDSNPDTLHVALTGIGLSHTCHYLSVLSLYGLSRTVFGDGSSRALPLLAAALHVISPAGAFLSAPYGEPVFSFLNFTGFYAYASALHDDRRGCVFARDVKFLVAGGLFATVTTVRSNGVLSGMLFAYDTVVGLAAIVSSGVSLSKLHRMFFVVLGGSLILLGVVGPQYRAFMVYCRNVDVRRIWCDNTIPSVYTFVQNHYWGSGTFLSYWKVSNLPLFCLAAPMLVIMGVSSWWPFQSPLDFDIRNKEPRKREEEVSQTEHRRTCLYRLAIPQAVLTVLALTNSHVQIINRISSGYPLWYWYIAVCVLEYGNTFHPVPKPLLLVQAMVLYSFIQGGLFASFLPPA